MKKKKRTESAFMLTLPPPIKVGDKVEWLPVARVSRVCPWGYREDPEDKGWWYPIPEQLEALEQAKEHLKRYSLRAVAGWLSEETGRPISHEGLKRRVKAEKSRKHSFRSSQELARLLAEALEKTEKAEQRIFGRRRILTVNEGACESDPTPS